MELLQRLIASDLAWAAPLLLSLIGCNTAPPKFADGEVDCIARDKIATAQEISECGKDVSGDCSTDSIYDRALARRLQCLEEN